MQKLGILDLSLKLKINTTQKINKTSPYTRKTPPPLRLSGPVRRSSRLGNATPVSYSEITLPKKRSFEMEEQRGDGSRPEVYTKKQERLLGDTNRSWTLFVDGYDRNGKRIYDPVNGKTCHQCRQKTLGHHTQCSECNRNRGQFCGDCLYMRYGENVIEAMENPEWVCPVCRGICNCSFCRQANGWAPTGIMYNKVSKMGYKSVAHYLIQTQCQTNDSKKEDTKVPVSAKRSLAFTSVEATPSIKESADSNINLKEPVEVESEKELGASDLTPESIAKDRGSLMPEFKDDKAGGELEDKKEDKMQTSFSQHGETDIYTETCSESIKVPCTGKECISENVAPKTRPDPTEILELTSKYSDNVVTSEEESVQILDNCDIVGKKTSSGSKKTRKRCDPMPDSIGSRLRLRKRQTRTTM